MNQLPQIFLPDPNVVALAVQQARIAELETRVSELEGAPETADRIRAGGFMSRLLASLDAPPSGRARPVWFDAAAYGRARLLGGGDVPWPSPAELSAFFAKIGGMFRSDAILVDLADLFAQRAAATSSSAPRWRPAADPDTPCGRCSATSRPAAPRPRRYGCWPPRAGPSRWC